VASERDRNRRRALPWPTEDQLLAWWVYLQFDEARAKQQTPETFERYVESYREAGRMKASRVLHNTYMAFRAKFRHPDD